MSPELAGRFLTAVPPGKSPWADFLTVSFMGKIFTRVVVVFLNTFIFYLFIFCFIGSLLLRVGFSSCGKWGLVFVAVCELLTAVASLVAEHGL